ncbi:MAG: hypothetical protein ACR2PT_08825 [Endozoicomonas sp.]
MKAVSMIIPVLLALLLSSAIHAGTPPPKACWETYTKKSPDGVLCWFPSGVSNKTKNLGHKRRNPDDDPKSECASKNSEGQGLTSPKYYWFNAPMNIAEQGDHTVIYGRDVDAFISEIPYCVSIKGRSDKPDAAGTSSDSSLDRVCSTTEDLPNDLRLIKFGYLDDGMYCSEEGMKLIGAEHYYNTTSGSMARGYWVKSGNCWPDEEKGVKKLSEAQCKKLAEDEMHEYMCRDNRPWCRTGNQQAGKCEDVNKCYRNRLHPKP